MSPSTETTAPFAAPSWVLTSLEPFRAALEYAGMRLTGKPFHPSGDGHAVVLFPGLGSDRRALAPLQAFCRSLGYATCDWGRGFNTGPDGDPEVWLDDLSRHVLKLVEDHDEPVSLVGWSLGGIYAREVAKRLNRRVRQVVTIGTPFAGSSQHTHAALVYRLLNGNAPDIDDSLSRQLRTAPPVPTTSIYSRSDGVVAWQACIQSAGHADTENVQVAGSHCGLGWNTEVFTILADRLSQPLRGWRPYASTIAAAPSRRFA